MDNDDRWTPSIKGENLKEIQASINEVVKLIYQYLHILEGRVGEIPLRDSVEVIGDITLTERLFLEQPADVPEVGEAGEIGLYYDGAAILKSVEGGAWTPLVIGSDGARVYRNSAQNIPDVTETALSFDTERYDTADFHSTLLNPNRFSIPVTGRYHIGACASFDDAGSKLTYEYITLRVNGAVYIARAGGETTTLQPLTVSCDYSLTAGDYVEVLVYHNTGGLFAVRANANYSPEFWIHRIA